MLGLMSIVAIAIIVAISGTEAAINNLQVLTFNTGLVASTVPAQYQVTREERREKIIEGLKDSKANFICLQEVYYGEDVQAIVEGVKGKYKYSFSKIHNEDGTVYGAQGPPNVAVCNPAPFIDLSICLSANCQGISDYTDLLLCVVQNCVPELTVVFTTSSQDCLSCFIATIPLVQEFFDTCANLVDDTNLRRINAPGLLMLAKKPLTETAYVDLHPGTVEAFHNGYLQAMLGKKKKIQVVCTHISVINVPVYFEANLQGQFASFTEQNLDEINTLVERFGGMERVVVCGDFNVGPAIPAAGVIQVAEANYNTLTAAFDKPLVNLCTFCPSQENPYNDAQNYIIDHIFARGFCFTKTRREFITSQSSLFSGDTQLPCSDHFALFAKLKRN